MSLFLKTNSYKIALSVILLLSGAALSSCQGDNTTSNMVKIDENSRNITPNRVDIAPIPSILDLFACKSADKAFVAAHRGTDAGSEYPEDSLIGLQKLVALNVPFAEIDVARLKDGTMIIFHDGVWDKRTDGPKSILAKPLAATTWPETQKLLMKDASRRLTATRPSKFSDILAYAKDKIYLEIDFKSTASEDEVITAIKDAGMLDQVILISYTTKQAQRLHELAPTAALSVGIFKPADIKTLENAGIPTHVMTGWTGKGPLTQKLADAMRAKNIPILAASFFSLDAQIKQSGDKALYTQFAKLPDLVVTDAAFDAQQVLEITGERLREMQACLAKRKN